MGCNFLLTIGSFLLTIDSFTYSCLFKLFYLQLELFYLKLKPFCLELELCSFSGRLRLRKIFVCNSGAGNGCANFMGAWKNASALQEKPCP